MILIDANVFMYAAGAPHPHKQPSLNLLERVAKGEVDALADVEVLQEILHRYRAAGRWEQGSQVFDHARLIVHTWLPIDAADLTRARALMDTHPQLGARDALHAAVCINADATAICSYDRDFDAVSAITRVEPHEVY